MSAPGIKEGDNRWIRLAGRGKLGIPLFMPNEQNCLDTLAPLGAWLVTSSTVGAIIVSRRPGNLIGWILCTIGVLFAFGVFSSLYAYIL